jgi:hypothetical protein
MNRPGGNRRPVASLTPMGWDWPTQRVGVPPHAVAIDFAFRAGFAHSRFQL